eukprot:GFYU01016311.1.p1 GENE.GFYU01016311.1~~GFYU01016311.1.p1  ORF type:complete len:185 (+),score=43.56 GFYU01016311.1:28-555(+)
MALNPNAAADSLQRLQNSYHQRLETQIDKITEHFMELLKSGKVTETESRTFREQYQADTHATNVVKGCENVLKMVYEIKTACILNDYLAIDAEMKTRSDDMNKCTTKAEKTLEELNAEILHGLGRLEEHYYNSKYKISVDGDPAKGDSMDVDGESGRVTEAKADVVPNLGVLELQ